MGLKLIDNFKNCVKCGESKDLSQFYKRSDRKGFTTHCKPCAVERNRINRKARPENHREVTRRHRLKYQYNMTIEKYNEMFIAQDGKCKICNKHQSEFKTALAVDHCHITNNVRGLLCTKCNTALGSFDDNKDSLLSAIKYLEES